MAARPVADPRTNTGFSMARPRTLLAHAGAWRSANDELSEALFLTQAYRYPSAEAAEARTAAEGDDAYVYSRFSNPTVRMFQDRLAARESAESCLAFATGMAAVTASLLGLAKAGDHVVSSRVLFGSCDWLLTELLPRLGIRTTLVDGRSPQAWKDALRPETRLVFAESIANPTLELVDIGAVADLAHDHGALLVVDNALASPACLSPLAAGADICVYSATKHIDGQGRCLGGAILGPAELVTQPLFTYLKHTGGSISPFNAWCLLKALETLELRVEEQCRTAARAAEALQSHPALAACLYPGLPSHPQHDLARRTMTGFGSVLALELANGKDGAFRFLNALELVSICNNFGDAKSLATHPATTTHSRMTPEARQAIGIADGLVRVSCGLEAAEDILTDLQRALDAAL